MPLESKVNTALTTFNAFIKCNEQQNKISVILDTYLGTVSSLFGLTEACIRWNGS